MNYRSFRIFILILIGSTIQSHAQNSALKPQWIGNTPRSHSGFYFVEVHSDMANSLSGARSSIMQELSAGVERTDKVSVKEIYEDRSTQTYTSTGTRHSSTDYYQLNLSVDGESRPIRSRRIDEYYKTSFRGGSKVLDYYAIYAVEKSGYNADFSDISTTSSYGARGLWRSAIIPGWGQFHKGANLKGGLILGGCAALTAGIVFTENQRSDYMRKIAQTHDVNQIKNYSTKADHFATARNICIGAAAALYLYNLIDAVAAPGARRIVVHHRSSAGQTYSFAPTVMPDGTAGMAASITF